MQSIQMKDIDANNNARNIGNRASSPPRSSSAFNRSPSGEASFRQKKNSCGETPSFGNVSSTYALCSNSSNSLMASKSFETPYGVVRNTSSSGFEPVRIHSGTSQESFRREMSAYRMNALPVLLEFADDNDDECSGESMSCKGQKDRCKGDNKGKEKGKKSAELCEVDEESTNNCLQKLIDRVCTCSCVRRDHSDMQRL